MPAPRPPSSARVVPRRPRRPRASAGSQRAPVQAARGRSGRDAGRSGYFGPGERRSAACAAILAGPRRAAATSPRRRAPNPPRPRESLAPARRRRRGGGALTMRPTGGGPAVRRIRAPAARWRAASPRATRAHDRHHAAGLELGLEDRQAAAARPPGHAGSRGPTPRP